MGAARSEASLGALLGMLASDSGQLVRQELRLASFEVTDRAKTTTGRVGVIALGGALAHAGLLGLLTALALGLANVMPLWAAALSIGAVFFAMGTGILITGIQAFKAPASTPSTPSAPAKSAGAQDGLR
jgi:predicted phage tail protein